MLDDISKTGISKQQNMLAERKPTISVVTPTYRRPVEVRELLANLSHQVLLPNEVVLVDATPNGDREGTLPADSYPFSVRHVHDGRGTARQRNSGIELASGEFIAFVDDDVRLEPNFFLEIFKVFERDTSRRIGGVVGYRTNQHFRREDRSRWRWYRRLRLLKTFEPGRYDFATGYPINNNMQEPFTGIREVDFMTTACAVWRRDVLDEGLRFDTFFVDYGVLEDAHFSLRAARKWALVQCGDARCEELRSPNGRADHGSLGFKSVVNYYFVFNDIAGPLSFGKQYRFWRFQLFELIRIAASAIRRRNWSDAQYLAGRLRGMYRILIGY